MEYKYFVININMYVSVGKSGSVHHKKSTRVRCTYREKRHVNILNQTMHGRKKQSQQQLISLCTKICVGQWIQLRAPKSCTTAGFVTYEETYVVV